MARADSTIRVNIIGDAKSLTKAAGQAEQSVGGLNKKLIAGGALLGGGLFVTDKLLEFGQTAIKEADRVGDAFGRIEARLGPDLAKVLRDRADDFHNIGASEGDMLELESRLIDIGTAAGIAANDLGPLAEDAAAAAAAMALIDTEGRDASFWIEKIGKAAASGDMRSLQELGISLDQAAINAQALADTGKATVDALTKDELAAAALHLVLLKLNPQIRETIDGSGDLEQKQADLGAQFETLTGKIGAGVEGPLTDFLDIVLLLVEKIELSIEIMDAMGIGFDELLSPIARAADGLRGFLGVVNDSIAGMNELIGLISTGAGAGITKGAGLFTGSGSSGSRRRAGTGGTVQVNVQGGSPEAIEQAVRNAVNTAQRRSGELEF